MTKKCNHTDIERQIDESHNGCILCDFEQLRGNLSLAEEGLASAMQEIKRLQTYNASQGTLLLSIQQDNERVRGALQKIISEGDYTAQEGMKSTARAAIDGTAAEPFELSNQTALNAAKGRGLVSSPTMLYDDDSNTIGMGMLVDGDFTADDFETFAILLRSVEKSTGLLKEIEDAQRTTAEMPDDLKRSLAVALVAQGAEYCGNWPCRLLKYHTGPCSSSERTG